MRFTPSRRAYLVEALGEDKVRELEKSEKGEAAEILDILDKSDIQFKDDDFEELPDLTGGSGNFGALLDRAGGRGELAALTGSKTMRPSASVWASRVRSDTSWIREVFGDPNAPSMEAMRSDGIDAMIAQIVRESVHI